MDISSAQDQLRSQGKAIMALAGGLTFEQARWKPDPESWSVVEVFLHLIYEERYDFRDYLDHILHKPDGPLPKPPSFDDIKDVEKSLQDQLKTFQKERQNSIVWLGKQVDPDWDATISFSWGEITAGDMLASWLAHDLLHLRQLVELRYALTADASRPYGIEYAGEW